MSAPTNTSKPKRRIAPIAVTTTPAPAAAPAVAAPAALPAAPLPLETLDRYIQESLRGLRDDVDGLLANSFVPDKRTLDELEAGVKRVRGCVDRYNTAAELAERAAAAERERLAAELQPLKIQRTEATKQIYARRAAALSGETNRFLYRCPLADPATGVCKGGNASRPCQPSVRKDIVAHIKRWHMPDPLREQRRSDAWWAEGATQARAKATRRA